MARTSSSKGPPGGLGKPRGGAGHEDEFDRLVAMVENIRKTLEYLVMMPLPVLPKELYSDIWHSWPTADGGFKTAIAALGDKNQRNKLRPQLEAAGFTGKMLNMKEASVDYHMRRIDKAVLTYSANPTLLEKFLKWVKPGFKVMNSVLGSLRGIPGVEIAKEFKEHFESACEVVETGQVE